MSETLEIGDALVEGDARDLIGFMPAHKLPAFSRFLNERRVKRLYSAGQATVLCQLFNDERHGEMQPSLESGLRHLHSLPATIKTHRRMLSSVIKAPYYRGVLKRIAESETYSLKDLQSFLTYSRKVGIPIEAINQ